MSFLKLMNGPEENAIDTANVSALITDMEAAAVVFGEGASDSIHMQGNGDERHQDRSRLLEAAKKLVEALEDPRQTALEIAKWVGSARPFDKQEMANILNSQHPMQCLELRFD